VTDIEPHKLSFAMSGYDRYIFSSTGPVYVDSGQRIHVETLRDLSAGTANGFVYLQGYLVDCGAGCTQ